MNFKIISTKDFFQDLPLEIQAKILSFLSFQEVFDSRFMSKYFYNALTNTNCDVDLDSKTVRYSSFNSDKRRGSPLRGPRWQPLSTDGSHLLETIQFRIRSLHTPTALERSFITSQLNVISNRGQRPIRRVLLKSAGVNIGWVVRNYNIVSLSNMEENRLWSAIESSNRPLTFLKELSFSYDFLDLNQLDVLIELAPNLESLNFNSRIKYQLYSGKKIFSNLKSLNITLTDNSLVNDYKSIISSFLIKAANLVNLGLLGNFLRLDSRCLGSAKELKKLKSLRAEFFYEQKRSWSSEREFTLLPVEENTSSLSELFIEGTITTKPETLTVKDESHAQLERFRNLQRERQKLNPLNDLKELYFRGEGCIHALNYYGIGANLRRLFVVPINDHFRGPDIVSELCAKCPLLEELVASWVQTNIHWLANIGQTHCERLRSVCLHSLNEHSAASNKRFYKDLVSTKIRDIYLCKELLYGDAIGLIDLGFRIYNHKNGLDIIETSSYPKEFWYVTDFEWNINDEV